MFVARGPGQIGNGSSWWMDRVDLQLCLGEYLLVDSLPIAADVLYSGGDISLTEKHKYGESRVRAPASTAQQFSVALDAFRLRVTEDEDLATALRAEIAFFKAMKNPTWGPLHSKTSRAAAVQKIFGSYFRTYWGPDFHGYGSPYRRNNFVISSQFASDVVERYFGPTLWELLWKDGFTIAQYGGGIWYMTPRTD